LSKGQPQIENVLEKDVDNLRVRIDDMKKQINDIYELLEALTNESKKKPSFILDKSNLDKNNLNEINA
jgi:chaperonin cofactor prefoldin